MVKLYFSNFFAGLKVICGFPVKRDHFYASLPFIIFALAISIGTFAAFDYVQQDGIVYQNTYGSAILGSMLFCGVIVALIVSHLEQDYFRLPLLLTIVLSVLFWFAILSSLIPFNWALRNQSWLLPMVILAVGVFASIRCILITFDYPKLSTTITAGLLISFIATSAWQRMYFPQIFSSYAPSETVETDPIDVEHVFYQQSQLMQKKMDKVDVHTAGQRDFYFVGFGSSDRQTVFESETKFVADIVAEFYATTGKSLILFNNSDSLDQEPFANRYNLQAALNDVGQKMDTEEDVLVLLLTSHGSENAELSVDLYEFPLRTFNAADLRGYLDQSKIKWRIVIISACYSGSFIEEVANDNTLIITAASSDRNSFGCSSDRELTVFGEAFFKQAFAQNGDFIEAFEQARVLVEQWEKEYDLEYSDPQIKLGKNIQEELNLSKARIQSVGSKAPSED